MTRLTFSIAFCLALTIPASGITQIVPPRAAADTAIAKRYFYQGIRLTKTAAYDSANFYFGKAREIYGQFADSLSWAVHVLCSNFIGDNLRKKGEYKNALPALNQALVIGKEKLGEMHDYVADTYNHFGTISGLRADFDKAIEYFNKSLAISQQLHGENHPAVARAYNNLGNAVGDKGDLDKASEYYAKALRIRRKLLGENHALVATTYLNIGTVYHVKGDYGKALECFNQALAIWRQALGDAHPNVALCYLNMGGVYQEQREYEQALAAHTKALELFKHAHGETSFDVGDCCGNIGNVYAGMGKYSEAIEFFNKSLIIMQAEVGENHPLVAMRYNNIGEAYYRQGQYDQAIEFHQKDLSILQKIYGTQHWDLAQAYQELGKCYYAKNDLGRALDYYQKSLFALVPNFRSGEVYSNPGIGQSIAPIKLLSALELKAEAFAGLYSTQSRDLKDLEMCMSTYRLASDLIDRIRSSYLAETSKLFLGSQASRIYGNAIRAALQAFAATQEAKYRHLAFSFAEKSKASVLLQALQDALAKRFAGIPPQLLEKEKDLRVGLAFYDTEIQKEKLKSDGRDEEKLREFEGRYRTLKNESEKLVARLEKSYPRYYELKYQTQTIAVAELQRTLDEQTAVLEYFMSDSAIYAFAVTKEALEIAAIPKDSAFDDLVQTLAVSLRNVTSKAAYLRSATILYQTLVKPLAAYVAGKSRWVIIPDGELYQIPFEALLRTEAIPVVETDYRSLPYLMKQHEISYHYSATLLAQIHKSAFSRQEANTFAGFAPVFNPAMKNGRLMMSNFDDLLSTTPARPDKTALSAIMRDGENLDELKFSEQEVRSIAALFGQHGRVYVHNDASEENFKHKINGNKYIHVATHGLINSENPPLSKLAFSQPEDQNAAEDGFLHASETYNLMMNADLLVLSSCESGTGKLVKGEGLMALTRGFLYSGARNIIASLWKVYDQHTSMLMVEMYRQIAAGKSYSAALRDAKLKMLANPETAGPQSWAGFVLIGK